MNDPNQLLRHEVANQLADDVVSRRDQQIMRDFLLWFRRIPNRGMHGGPEEYVNFLQPAALSIRAETTRALHRKTMNPEPWR